MTPPLVPSRDWPLWQDVRRDWVASAQRWITPFGALVLVAALLADAIALGRAPDWSPFMPPMLGLLAGAGVALSWWRPAPRWIGVSVGGLLGLVAVTLGWLGRPEPHAGLPEAVVLALVVALVLVTTPRGRFGWWLGQQAGGFALLVMAGMWLAHRFFGDMEGSGARAASAALALGWMWPAAAVAGGLQGLLGFQRDPRGRRLSRASGALVAGVMSFTALAWMVGALAWLKLPTVPFATHTATAVALLGLGVAVWLSGQARQTLATVMVAPATLLSLTNLWAHWQGGTGQVPWLPVARVFERGATPLLGPNIGVALLLGIVGVLASVHLRHSQWREAIAWGAGFVLGVVAMLALFGYALGVEHAASWGPFAPMAPMTALAVGVLGIGIGFSGAQVRHLSAFRITWLPVLVAGSAALVTSIIWVQVQQEQTETARRTSARILEGIEERVAFEHHLMQQAISRMARRASVAATSAPDAFAHDAAVYLSDFEGLRALALVKPGSAPMLQARGPSAPAEMARLLQGEALVGALERSTTGTTPIQLPVMFDDGVPGLLWVLDAGGSAGRAAGGHVVAAVELEALVGRAMVGVVPTAAVVLRPVRGGDVMFSQGEPQGRESQGKAWARGLVPAAQPLVSAEVWPPSSMVRARQPLALLLIGLMSGGLLAVALRFSGLARHRADLAERVQKSLAQEIEARIDQQATLEQALEQVRHSETRFHGMANAVADALWDWDLRGNSLWWGEGVTKLFGHRPEDLGSSVEAWKRLIHPDDLQRVGDSLQQVWKSGGSSWTVEYRFARRRGGWAYVLDRGHVIRDGDGVALRMVGGMTDLTESRELHATIAREREFLAALLDSLNEGVIACDAQGHLSHYTPVVAELHSTSELPARPGDWSAAYGLCDATTGERLAADEVPLARALAGETVRDFEMLIHPSTGPERLVQVNGQAVYSREGTQLGAVVTMRDITDQRRLELEKEQLNRERGIVLEAMGEGLLGVDPAGACVFANGTAATLLGRPLGELIAGDVHALLHGRECPHEQAGEPCPLRVLSCSPIPHLRADSRIQLASGPGLPVNISISPAPTESGLGSVMTFTDISQRVREERVEAGKREVLALIAERRPVEESLARLPALFEASFPGAMAAIAVLDPSSYRLRMVAPGSLPPVFGQAAAVMDIGEHNGPCAAAAFSGERVVVTDLAVDEQWENGRDFALGQGLRAGWGTPVRASTGEVMATLGVYYREPRGPTPAEIALVEDLAALAGVALEQSAAYSRVKTSEQRFRSLFQEHPDAVYAFNAHGRFVAVNAGFEAMLGVEAREVIDHHFDELVAPGERNVTRHHFERALRGEAVTYESRGVRRDGSTFEVRVTNFPMMSDGDVVGVFGVAHDISELRTHERELARALSQAEAVSSQLRRLSQAGVRINSVSGSETLCQTLADLVRLTLGAATARIEVIDPQSERGTRQARSPLLPGEDAFPGGGPLRTHTFELVGNDGQALGQLEIELEASKGLDETTALVAEQLVQLASAAVERMLLIARLTERDRFFEMSKEIFVVFDPKTNMFRQVNPTFCEVTGYDEATLCGRDFVSFLHPADQPAARARLRAGDVQQGVRTFSNRYMRHDGGVAWIEWTSVPGMDGMVYGVGRDVTERTRAQVALQQSLADLATRNRELQDFAFVASHDLQEPLRKIRSFTDRLLRRHAEALDEQARDYLDRSANAAARMQLLIENLLAYSRVTSQGKPFQQVDLERVFTGVLDDLEATIEAAGAEVVAGAMPVVPGDASQMGQVLQNLVANALKFRAPDRAPRVEVTVDPAVGEDGVPGWHLRVQDNGIGFEDKYGERIFAPFQRLHGRHEFEGTGIGLAIVRKIAERHRGRTWATGIPGAGACFHVWLPAEQTDPQ